MQQQKAHLSFLCWFVILIPNMIPTPNILWNNLAQYLYGSDRVWLILNPTVPKMLITIVIAEIWFQKSDLEN